MSDAIDTLADIAPGSLLDGLRRQKPITRTGAQDSFDALFRPADFGPVSPGDRAAIALFVAALHDDAPATEFYGAMLGPDHRAAILTEATRAAAAGPYGAFPAGPLSVEDRSGPIYAASDAIEPRLAAALAHAHMLVFHPRDSAPAHMRALEAAGWSADAIVTLSQLVAFLSFQIRAAAGLRALKAASS